jgi:hypothetical protein
MQLDSEMHFLIGIPASHAILADFQELRSISEGDRRAYGHPSQHESAELVHEMHVVKDESGNTSLIHNWTCLVMMTTLVVFY